MKTRSRKSSAVKPDSGRSSPSQSVGQHEQVPNAAKKKATVSKSSSSKVQRPKKKETKKSHDTSTTLQVQKVVEGVFELEGYEDQAKLLCSLLKSTAKSIESNSVLICGPRGCGKSTFVDQCLKSECDPNKTEMMYFNGFMGTDATKLFHNIQQATDSDKSNITDLMECLIEKCKSGDRTTIIVLDEFDRFCKHTDQTFLYNIFDLTHKCRQLCIIGITTRLDCLELLEKRVKSRMNQSVIYLNSPFSTFSNYSKFASDLEKFAGVQNVESDEHLLKIQFEKNFSLRNLKHAVLEKMCDRRDKSLSLNPIVCSMTSLSHMEFLILAVAENYCKNNGINSLPCDSILKSVSKFTGRTRMPRDLAYKLIGNLVSYGLLMRSASSDGHFLNDWTMLQLNFSKEDLKGALDQMSPNLPQHLQQLINLR